MMKGIENIANRQDILGIGGDFPSLKKELAKTHKSTMQWIFFFQITQTIATCAIFYYRCK